METDILASVKTIADLGISGILIYFLNVLWKEKKETDKRKDDARDSKDTVIESMYANALEIIKNNTQTQEQLKAVIESNTKAIDSNTRVQESLTEKIYRVIASK